MSGAIYAPTPYYPGEARRLRLEGAGIFGMHIKPDGKVSAITIFKSTGHVQLDRAALGMLVNWRFPPGKPRKIKMPIKFSLGGWRELVLAHTSHATS